MEKRRSLAEFEPGIFGLIRRHIATTPLRMIADFVKSLKFNAFPWNFRRQTIEPYLTNWKNDSKQSDEIKADWNQATDSKNNVNAFHGNERTYLIQSRHNSSAK